MELEEVEVEVEKKQDDLNTNVEADEGETICDSESTANKLWGNANRYRGVNFSSSKTRN